LLEIRVLWNLAGLLRIRHNYEFDDYVLNFDDKFAHADGLAG
jgi:hypothetical protein